MPEIIAVERHPDLESVPVQGAGNGAEQGGIVGKAPGRTGIQTLIASGAVTESWRKAVIDANLPAQQHIVRKMRRQTHKMLLKNFARAAGYGVLRYRLCLRVILAGFFPEKPARGGSSGNYPDEAYVNRYARKEDSVSCGIWGKWHGET